MTSVSVINAACRSRDAIGEAVHETCRAIAHNGAFDVRLYTFYSDADDIDTRIIGGCGDILSDPFFLRSSAMIVHFGFYTPLMRMLLGGTANIIKIVRYHNITPKRFVEQSAYEGIDLSRSQLCLLDAADQVWADSPFNREDLIDAGITPENVVVSPLFVKSNIVNLPLCKKISDDFINIMYVGRFVKSKGVIDLIRGSKILKGRNNVRINLVGAFTYSDLKYIAELKNEIICLGLSDIIHFIGEVSDVELTQLYQAAHILVIPSYHEGFCVPLAEALIGGLFPIAYAAGNVPHMIRDVGRLVPTGDVDALAKAIGETVDWFERARGSLEIPPLNLGGEVVAIDEYGRRVQDRAAEFDVGRFRRRVVSDLQRCLDLKVPDARPRREPARRGTDSREAPLCR